MSHAPLPVPLEPRPVRSIPLPRVARHELEAGRLLGDSCRNACIRDAMARALNDVVDTALGVERRPGVELATGTNVVRLGRDDVAVDETAIASSGAGFELRRGRSSVRVIRTGAAAVACNGWLLETGVPVSLRDKDSIDAGGLTYRVAYDASIPRPAVEIGPVRLAQAPAAPGLELRFALEPANEPILVACDGASARAALDLAIGGTGERPFDRTALVDVDRAVVEWLIDKAAHAAVRAIAGTSMALRLDCSSGPEPDLWLAAAVRIGGYCGVWWLGTTRRAVAVLAPELRRRSRRSLATLSAIGRIDVTVAARVTLGHLTPAELAGLETGDLLVARGDARRSGMDLTGSAELCVTASDDVAIAATVEQDGPVVRARLGSAQIDERSETMNFQESQDPARPFEAALDELRVTVRVEVARRRIPLASLLSLAPGDVVELHSAVANDVTLTVDGGAFARGELVDADGALAVRILALGGPR